jgi:hypothetical protein
MTQPMPFADAAIVDRRKLTDCLLDEAHPRGRHKAKLFRSALGLTANDADWLRDVLLDAAKTLDASPAGSSTWGEQ